MSQKRTLELTQDEINLILRALRMAERTLNNFRVEYREKTDSMDEINQVVEIETQCFDLRFAIKKGQKDVKNNL